MNLNRKLVLADGTVFFGRAFGANGEVIREVVFQTAKTGYEDILTDPDNCHQIVVMTSPVEENPTPCSDAYDPTQGASALIIGTYTDTALDARLPQSLDAFLKMHHIPGLCDVDTVALSKKIHSDGVMYGILVDADVSDDEALVRLTAAPHVTNHVKQVSPKQSYTVTVRHKKHRIALIAFTAKKGILNELVARQCEVVVFPYNASLAEIEASEPDGVVFSSGPGDPEDLPELLPIIRALQARYPLFGVCLGHQLFAIANGATTSKMKSGHRDEDVLIYDIISGKTLRTVQNHGYHVDADSLTKTDLEITQYAIGDHSIEGLKHKAYPAFSVQYHPEAAPHTHDTNDLFDQFLEMLGK